jgi:hypothetical protein
MNAGPEMKHVQLTVSLTREKMQDMVSGHGHYDIGTLIEAVPSATIVSGDRAISVRVEVDARHVESLRERVAGFCNVNPYREFTLLKGLQRA